MLFFSLNFRFRFLLFQLSLKAWVLTTRKLSFPVLTLPLPFLSTRRVSAPPCPGVKLRRSSGKTTFPRVHRGTESSNQSAPAGAISVEGVVVRPVNMALFPAFADVNEASGGGASRKGKHPKRIERDNR